MNHYQQALPTFVVDTWMPVEDMAPKLREDPIVESVKPEAPNEIHEEQLFAMELLLVPPPTTWLDHLA